MILDMRCKIKLPVRFSDAPFLLELGSRFSIICFGKEVVVTDCQFCDPGRAKKRYPHPTMVIQLHLTTPEVTYFLQANI